MNFVWSSKGISGLLFRFGKSQHIFGLGSLGMAEITEAQNACGEEWGV